MEPQAEPARVAHALPGLHASSRSPDSFGSYRTPPTAIAAPSDRYYGPVSPSQCASSSAASTSEGVQLPSLRTLINPELLNPAAPNASPAPVTRLPSLSGFDSSSSADRPVNGHGYPAREDSQPSSNAGQPVLSAPQPYPAYTSAPSIAASVADARVHAPVTELSHQFLRRGSISSGASAGSENQSPREDHSEGSALRVKRRIGDISRGPARAARCVGQQEVAGEGLCYVYEDGSYCRTIIDGEAVNPSWGVTKAGKPRKRLAQACLTCREKKIKCEPGVPKCAQCTRARRTCRGSAMHAAMARSGLDSDPYEADPALTKHLLDLYFNYVNSSTYAVFAREPFMRWVTNGQPKTADEKLVIYSLLVMGNVFSTDSEWRRIEKQLLDICNSALQKRIGKFTLHMCLSRMAVSALKLNLEEGAACEEGESLFGFDRRMSEECKQRTFWAGFLMDRYNGFSGGTLFTIDVDDVCVRLPCSKAAYDAGRPLDTPIFDGGHIEERALLRNISPMGYHALVSAIWGDVWIFTTRAARKYTSMRLNEYNTFYDQTNERLDEWLACLPYELQYNEANFYAAVNAGYAGTFVGMHALHQATIMRLNRLLSFEESKRVLDTPHPYAL
ncbi:putative c6 transcription factor [Diplodia seriata]|uniref:Putative c6 transcription factor n=1 Tax=Diplodia seriata TaxID=420778 RepID=A0A0G2H080_9PEZI|nr:putative c6 transcription factor [Diplodia seriata]